MGTAQPGDPGHAIVGQFKSLWWLLLLQPRAREQRVQQKPIAKVKRRTPSFLPSALKVDVPLGSRYFPADRIQRERERVENGASEQSVLWTLEEG